MSDYAIAALLVIGGFFIFVGSFGLLKLPDFYTRLHAPTKATTLGIGAVLMASVVATAARDGSFSVHEIVISLFLFITAPVSANMLAKAALHKKVPMVSETRGKELNEAITQQKPPRSAPASVQDNS